MFYSNPKRSPETQMDVAGHLAKGEDMSLQIQRTFCLFDGDAFDCMRVNHGRLQVTMAQQLLDCANIEIGGEQMTCKTVAKGMRCRPFTFDLSFLCGKYLGCFFSNGEFPGHNSECLLQ
jgi:hypothetical protein